MQLRWIVLALAACNAADTELASTAAVLVVPPIETALTCAEPDGTPGVIGEVPVPAAGTDLQFYEIPTSVFPDAVCNDGTPAILYFRPGSGNGLNSWLIVLEGGGGCTTAEECADRFCSEGTNFGRQQMGSGDYPTTGIAARGLQSLTRGPFYNYNQVLIHYCSSDGWFGASPTVDGTATDPASGSLVTFSTRFNGDAILKAAIRVLRQDGATLPPFTANGVSMPDLDIAWGDVVIAGGSAGGMGVISQLDRVVADLRARHSPAPVPFYAGLIDSAFPPRLQGLDYQLTPECAPAGCTWNQYLTATKPYWSRVLDDSCATLHTGNDIRCGDLTHVVRNHVMTPFFVRQGERDKLLSKTYADKLLATTPTATVAMTVAEFGSLVSSQAMTTFLSTWSGEETPTMIPGAFVPDCQTHDPTHDNLAWFNTRIDASTFADAWADWRSGGTNAVVDDGGPVSTCACASGTNC